MGERWVPIEGRDTYGRGLPGTQEDAQCAWVSMPPLGWDPPQPPSLIHLQKPKHFGIRSSEVVQVLVLG